MKTRLTCFVCALLLVFMFGCQTGKSGWEFNAETLDEITRIVENFNFYYSMQVWEQGEGTQYGENVLTSDQLKVDFVADYLRWDMEYDENVDYSKLLKSDVVRILDDTLGTALSDEFLSNSGDYLEPSDWAGDYFPFAYVDRVETDGDQVVVHGAICWSGNLGLSEPRGFTAIFRADKIQLVSLSVGMNEYEFDEYLNGDFN